jgi:hypothetical protein
MILIASPLYSVSTFLSSFITPQEEQSLCHKKQLAYQYVINTAETGAGRFGRTRRGFTVVISMIFDALRRTHPMDAEDPIFRYSRTMVSMVIFNRRKSMGLERKA